MGVQNLWSLLSPIGRRVSIESLEGKTLAIDVSVWITQFIKAMRDDEGKMKRNAHLIGTIRRVLKLLFHRIRPLFVFDGATPQLKLRTVQARRRKRNISEVGKHTNAQKLLLSIIKKQMLEEKIKGNSSSKKDIVGPGDTSSNNELAMQEDEVGEENPAFVSGFNPSGTSSMKETNSGSFGNSSSSSSSSSSNNHNVPWPEGGSVVEVSFGDFSMKGIVEPIDNFLDIREKGLLAVKFEDGSTCQVPFPSTRVKLVAQHNLSFPQDLSNINSSSSSSSSFHNKASATSKQNKMDSDEDVEWVDGYEALKDKNIDDVDDEMYLEDELGNDVSVPKDGDFDVDTMASLRVLDRKNIAEELRRQLRATNRREYMSVKNSAELYSLTQLTHFKRSVKLNNKLQQVQKLVDGKEEGGTIDGDGGKKFTLEKKVMKSGYEDDGFVVDDHDSDDSQDEWGNNFTKNSKKYDYGDEAEGGEEEEEGLRYTSSSPRRKIKKLKRLIKNISHTEKNSSLTRNYEEEEEFHNNIETNFPKKIKRSNDKIASLVLNDPENADKGVALNDPEIADNGVQTDLVATLNHITDEISVSGPQKKSEIIELIEDDASDESGSVVWESDKNSDEDSDGEITNVTSDIGISLSEHVGISATVEERTVSFKRDEANDSELKAQISELPHLLETNSTDTSDNNNNVFEDITEQSPHSVMRTSSLETIEIKATESSMSDTIVHSRSEEISKALENEKLFHDDLSKTAENNIIDVTDISENAKELTSFQEPSQMSNNDTVKSNIHTSIVQSNEHNLAFDDNLQQQLIPSHLHPVNDTTNDNTKIHSISQQPILLVDREISTEELRKKLQEEKQHEQDLRKKRNNDMRDSEGMTSEMKEEVIELLQAFDLPYIVAPFEAEAQCAILETLGLVDGIVTEDSDVFLFGGETVYRNIFNDRKYVEVYLAKDAEKELGVERQDLVALAFLLGSDYTEGINGIGIVNAMEILQAFPMRGQDNASENVSFGLSNFKKWLDGYDFKQSIAELQKKVPKKKRKNIDVEDDDDDDGEASLDSDEIIDKKLITFQKKHKSGRSKWLINGNSDKFPDKEVITAYLIPAGKYDTTTFEWTVPKLHRVRDYCLITLGWTDAEMDTRLDPVILKYSQPSTQLRISSYFSTYEDDTRFAKISSSRLEQSVKQITGRDVSALSVNKASKKKSKSKSK